MKLSNSEKKYLLDGILQNSRVDGRQRLDYRSFVIENSTLSQSNGSSRVKLFETEVVVSVKLQIGVPSPEAPMKGILAVNIESAPSLSRSHMMEVASSMNEILQSALDLESLCIRENEACWMIFVDCLVLDYSGNVFDAVGLGIKAALSNTQIPSIEVIEGEDGVEVFVSDDRTELKKLGIGEVPTFVTFGVFSKSFVVDPGEEEEKIMESAISVGVMNDKIFSVHKRNAFSLHPSEIQKIMKSSIEVGNLLKKRVDKVLHKIEDYDVELLSMDQ